MRTKYTLLRITAAAVLCALAAARLFVSTEFAQAMDATFFSVIAGALILALIPLDRLSSLKAGGVEVSLQHVEVRGAIASLNLDRIRDAELRSRLTAQHDRLRTVRGARVLWIDDCPHKVIAERRLMRALGIEIIPAISSEAARHILDADNDFDLIISDVQRNGESYKITGGVDIHEGVNFIVWLRTMHEDSVIKNLPVVFYAAYDWERLVEFTRPARELPPEAQICNSVVDLLPKLITRLTEARATPITVASSKEPTPPRWGA